MKKLYSFGLILLGIMIVISVFFLDKIGFGNTGSFGIGQFLLLVIGIVFFLLGLLGKRFFQFYRDMAVLFLNTIVLLAIIELCAIIIGRTSFRVKHDSIQDLPYYAAQDWTETYWQEANQSIAMYYKPYVTWRHQPYSGKMVNMDEGGLRNTPGAMCTPDSYKVFTFGGSTMIGWGAPDWGTIPAYLQNELENITERPVCVRNLAADGYVSTQSLISLMLQLQAGNIPDLVIFYDGINDIIAAHESGQPTVHVTLSKIVNRFEQKENPLMSWIKGTRTYTYLRRWADKYRRENNEVAGIKIEDLAESVVKAYVNNYKLVGALAREYGFNYLFFLQPHFAVDEKAMTAEEDEMKSDMSQVRASLAKVIYEKIDGVAGQYGNLWNISDVFRDEESQIYIDHVGHVTPEGNRIVAQEMVKKIEGSFGEKK